jgi:hypothetical protein
MVIKTRIMGASGASWGTGKKYCVSDFGELTYVSKLTDLYNKFYLKQKAQNGAE